MVTEEEIIKKAITSIEEFDTEMAEEASKEAINIGMDPVLLIENGFTKAMTDIGVQFEEGKLFLPHVLAASEAMNAGINILKPEMEKRKAQTKSIGKIIICTIEGDIHSIGKDIVSSMLNIAGFDVIDLGRDVPVKDIVSRAVTEKPLLVATSALMTTTMVNQIQVEEQLKEAGVRQDIKTMVGGAPCTQDWADKIGADIYGESATDAVSKVKSLFI